MDKQKERAAIELIKAGYSVKEIIKAFENNYCACDTATKKAIKKLAKNAGII